MAGLLGRYTHWLHTQWPAGTVEQLPVSGAEGATNLPGVRIVGDLTGIPLLKFSSHTGASAVRAILREGNFSKGQGETLDLAIIGAGVAGISAAIEAKKAGLRFAILEATETFSTVINFPKRKPIYTYPTEMKLEGGLHFEAEVKEDLLREMQAQQKAAGVEVTPARVERVERTGGELVLHLAEGEPLRARRVLVAIGRSGNFRKLNVPGEELEKVSNRLFDPHEFSGQKALVVGGGDSALETAIALARAGAEVTLSYRRKEFARPKPENITKIEALARDRHADVEVERPSSDRVNAAMTDGLGCEDCGSLKLALGTEVTRIEADQVYLQDGSEKTLPNDVVFTMLGREAPLEFFRRSGLKVRGDWNARTWISCLAFVLFCVVLYHWKSNHPQEFPVQRWASQAQAFPYNVPALFGAAGGKLAEWSSREGNLLYTIKRGLGNPAFYYTLAYCTCVVVFGVRRIQRRRTPYVKWQTGVLIASQCIPLFILPELLLPWMGRNGWFEPGQPLTLAGEPALRKLRRLVRPRARLLAGLWLHPRLPVERLQRLHRSSDVALAGDFLPPDFRAHPADYFSLGQRRLLRLDLLLRRARRDHGRRPPRKDAARPGLESGQHGRARRRCFSPSSSSRSASPAGRLARARGPRPGITNFSRASRSSATPGASISSWAGSSAWAFIFGSAGGSGAALAVRWRR